MNHPVGGGWLTRSPGRHPPAPTQAPGVLRSGGRRVGALARCHLGGGEDLHARQTISRGGTGAGGGLVHRRWRRAHTDQHAALRVEGVDGGLDVSTRSALGVSGERMAMQPTPRGRFHRRAAVV